MKSSENSESESKSWSLSLVKIGDDKQEEAEEQPEPVPVPLDICLPEEMPVLPSRSPSFLQASPAPNISWRKSDKQTVSRSCLESSPRLSSALVEPESSNVGPIASESTNKKNKNKDKTFMIVGGNKSVRRSPRFTSISAAETQNGKTLSLSVEVHQCLYPLFFLQKNKRNHPTPTTKKKSFDAVGWAEPACPCLTKPGWTRWRMAMYASVKLVFLG